VGTRSFDLKTGAQNSNGFRFDGKTVVATGARPRHMRMAPPPFAFMCSTAGEYAVNKAFYIPFEHAVEILPGCCFELADAGDAGMFSGVWIRPRSASN
jgi:hypothetical protein